MGDLGTANNERLVPVGEYEQWNIRQVRGGYLLPTLLPALGGLVAPPRLLP